MIFFDPLAIPFLEWERQLCVGFVFDYLEGRLWITVEIVALERGPITTLDLRVVDDVFSRRPTPGRGDAFQVDYRAGEQPIFTWVPHTRGYFARHAAYHASAR